MNLYYIITLGGLGTKFRAAHLKGVSKIMKLGEKIRAIRLNRGIKQVELAKLAEISNSYLSDIEMCRVSPSMKTLKKLGNALCVDLPILTDHTILTANELINSISENRLQFVFSGIYDGLVLANLEKEIIDVNDNFCTFTGWKKSELISKRATKYISNMNIWKVNDLINNDDLKKIIIYEDLFNVELREPVQFRINLQKIHVNGKTFIFALFEVLETKHQEIFWKKTAF
jgi:PAS domain S-box-containing protein